MTMEPTWIVDATPERISATDPHGETRFVNLTDLHGVMIETNGTGPFGADVWWLLFGAEDRLACAFPQGASGEQDAVDILMDLAGFDHEAMVMAMGSTANAVFPLWRSGG